MRNMSFIRRRTEAVLVGGILLALLLLQNHKNAIAAQSSPRFPLQVIPMPHPFGTPETNVTTLSSSRKNSAFPNLYHRDAYVLTSTSAWSVLVPDDDDVLQRTSLQAQRHEECRYATNGGPFHRDGSSVGTVVSNGRTIDVGTDDDFDGGSVGFGMAQLPFSQQQQQQQRSATERNSSSTSRCDTTGSLSSSHWVIGSMDSAEQWTDLGVTQFVTGFDWLVYNGTAVAANNTTGAEEAPRTAIGVNDRGILMLLVADGCEHCLRDKGLTLEQLANGMVRLGAQFAINLDGGSSSVLVGRGGKLHNNNNDQNNTVRVLSRPTCLDLPVFVCERPVASVVCIHGTKTPLATTF